MASSIVSISSSNPSFGNVLHHQSDNNILKLKLKKPKSWNWELSTSKSSAHIEFPRVLLYDNKNKLLADIEEANFVINGKENTPLFASPGQCSSSDTNDRSRIRKSSSFCVSTSTINSPKSPASNDQCNSLNSNDVPQNPNEIDAKLIESHDIPNEVSKDVTETPEAPIYIYSAKGLVKRDFNAKEFDTIRKRSNAHVNINPNAQTETTTDASNNPKQCRIEQMSVQSERNPVMKCKSMAEISGIDLTKKQSKRKIRRTKSSASTKYSIRNTVQSISSSSSDENIPTPTRRPIYRIQKCAAGAIIVPEDPVFNSRVRRRCRSKSAEKSKRKNDLNTSNDHVLKTNSILLACKSIDNANNSLLKRMLSDPMDSTLIDKSLNKSNEIASIVERTTDKHYKNHNEHIISIKSENNRLNVDDSVVSSASSANNDVNNGMDAKQKKAQLNRKVSFVQFNGEMTENNGCNETIHIDCIDVPSQTREFNQNGKCISTRPNGRKKKMTHSINIKKSASVTSFSNNYSMATAAAIISASDTDDYDSYAKPPMRHKNRRVSQRPKSNIASYHHHGESLFIF